MVVFSSYPDDPRPRRAVEALLKEGMHVDLVCLGNGSAPRREVLSGLDVLRIPITHRRNSKLAYVCNYSAFILISACIFALRSLKRRYDLAYVHNMPDVLVISCLVPKIRGAKVILDLHDPMPELMRTIFKIKENSPGVRFIQKLEKWSIAHAHLVLTVNVACKRIFAARSCPPDKIGVVMNSPDERIIPFRTPRSYAPNDAIPTKRFVIMYHGSLVERNGLDLAVDALAQARQVIPAAELRIYGHKTPFLEDVMDTVRKRHLEDSVHYLGSRKLEDLVREIEDCDIGVVPNHRNAFTEINTPTRIFEYLALGKPVIAPRTPGVQDYFNSESLLFFEPGSVEDLAHKLEQAALHYSDALASAERGQCVYLRHTWSQERQTLVQLVRGLLNGRQSVPVSLGYSQGEDGCYE